jgi:hypothetical protein
MNSKTKSIHGGFIIAPAIIVLAITLASALSVVVFLAFKKGNSSAPDNSVATEQSTNAFQAANSGSEAVLKKIYKEDKPADLTALAETISSTSECSDGVISGSTSTGNYKVSLYDGQGTQLKNCNDSTWRGQVAQLKSEGVSGDTSRGIDVAVAAEPTPGITGGCVINGTYSDSPSQFSHAKISSVWGVGCKDVLTDFQDNQFHYVRLSCSSRFLKEGTHGQNPGIGGGPIPSTAEERDSVALPGYSCGQAGPDASYCLCVKK